MFLLVPTYNALVRKQWHEILNILAFVLVLEIDCLCGKGIAGVGGGELYRGMDYVVCTVAGLAKYRSINS